MQIIFFSVFGKRIRKSKLQMEELGNVLSLQSKVMAYNLPLKCKFTCLDVEESLSHQNHCFAITKNCMICNL